MLYFLGHSPYKIHDREKIYEKFYYFVLKVSFSNAAALHTSQCFYHWKPGVFLAANDGVWSPREYPWLAFEAVIRKQVQELVLYVS